MRLADEKRQCSKCLDLGISKESVALIHTITVVEKGRDVYQYMPVCMGHLTVYNEEHPKSMYLTIMLCVGLEQDCTCNSCALIRQSKKIKKMRVEMRTGDEALKAQLDRADQHERNWLVLQKDHRELYADRNDLFHQVKELTGDGLVLKGPESFGELTDDAMDFMAHDLREGKKILAIKYLRGHTVDFSFILPDGQCTRLKGHISLSCSNRIIGGMKRAILYERNALSRKMVLLQGVKHDLTLQVSSLKGELKANSESQTSAYCLLQRNNHELRASITGHEAVNLDLCNQIKELQDRNHALMQTNIRYENTKSENLRLAAEVSSFSEAMKNKAAYVEQLEAECDELKTHMEAEELKDVLRINVPDLDAGAVRSQQQTINELKVKTHELESSIESRRERTTKIESMLETWKDTNEKNNQTIETLNGFIQSRDTEIEKLRSQVSDLNCDDHNDYKRHWKMVDLNRECNEKAAVKHELEQKCEQVSVQQQTIDELRIQTLDLNRECNEKSKFTEELSTGLEEKNRIITKLEDELNQQHGILHSIEKQFNADWDYDETP